MNTTFLDMLFPGMVAKYGKDRYVDVVINVYGVDGFAAKEGGMSVNVDLGMQFVVEKADGTYETALDLTFEKIDVGFNAGLEGL